MEVSGQGTGWQDGACPGKNPINCLLGQWQKEQKIAERNMLNIIGKKVEWMSLKNRKKAERRRKERLLLYLRKMKQSGYILPVTTK